MNSESKRLLRIVFDLFERSMVVARRSRQSSVQKQLLMSKMSLLENVSDAALLMPFPCPYSFLFSPSLLLLLLCPPFFSCRGLRNLMSTSKPTHCLIFVLVEICSRHLVPQRLHPVQLFPDGCHAARHGCKRASDH